MIKKPTLQQLIDAAEKKVNPDDWYRKNLLTEMFKGMSPSSLNVYQKEMETIPEFAEGVLKPGHSSTYIHVHTFIWFLKWKQENKYRSKKVSPKEVLR